MTELSKEERNAVFVDLVTEVSELVDLSYKKILSGEYYEIPDFEKVIEKLGARAVVSSRQGHEGRRAPDLHHTQRRAHRADLPACGCQKLQG